MKLRISIIFLFLLFGLSNCDKTITFSSPNIICIPSNLQIGIIAFYPFSAGSLNDFSGNNNLSNNTSASPGADRNGNISCAYNFVRANGDFLQVTNPTFINNFQLTAFSISLWYKPLGNRKGDDYELLIGRDSSLHCPDTYGQWSVGLYDCRRAVFGINQYSIWDNYFNNSSCDSTSNDLSNVWQYLVVTCKGTDLKIYRNAVLSPQPAGTGCSTNKPTINAGNLFLGKEYTGLLDDIIIYNRILTQSEINQLYNLPACCQ